MEKRKETLGFPFGKCRQRASSCVVAQLSSENPWRHHVSKNPPWQPRKRDLMNRDRRYWQIKKCFIYYSLISRVLVLFRINMLSEIMAQHLLVWHSGAYPGTHSIFLRCRRERRNGANPPFPVLGGHLVAPPTSTHELPNSIPDEAGLVLHVSSDGEFTP